MKTLGQVIAWLMSKGAPMPKLTTQAISYPGGGYSLTTLRFEKPGYTPDPDAPEWMQALDTSGVVTVMVDLLMMDPSPTLTDLQLRGMANGDPNVRVEYPN